MFIVGLFKQLKKVLFTITYNIRNALIYGLSIT